MKELIKKLFTGFTKTEIKLASATLEDGTKITSESKDFVVGAEVFVVTQDGNLPAPDGSYTTTDGVTFSVVEGKITESSVSDEEVTEPENEELATAETWMNEVSEMLTTIQERISNLEQTVADLLPEEAEPTAEPELSVALSVEEPEAETVNVIELQTELENLRLQVAELSKLPATQSIKTLANDAIEQKPLSFSEKIVAGMKKK